MKRNILLCVTGGIAAYKSIDLASQLIKQGFEVKTILTKNALEFVSELNFKAITKNSVHTEMFAYTDPIPHISLADWADLIVVAPATANMIAKAANGIADDLISSVLLAHTHPVLWVPAMNVHMFNHPATQENIATLIRRNNYVLEPITGLLACGYEGKGKLPPVEEIIYAIKTYLNHKPDLKGKKILVTAGGTLEIIDPMRNISNKSSGKTGLAIARAAALRGAEVYLVYANVSSSLPYNVKQAISAESVTEMDNAVCDLFPKMDTVIMAAAVSDFTPVKPSTSKIKKNSGLTLELIQTIDILAKLGKSKTSKQKLIGFAAETDDLIKNAKSKLKSKNLDMIVANLLSVSGKDDSDITIITKKGSKSFQADKFTNAHNILDAVKKL